MLQRLYTKHLKCLAHGKNSIDVSVQLLLVTSVPNVGTQKMFVYHLSIYLSTEFVNELMSYFGKSVYMVPEKRVAREKKD